MAPRRIPAVAATNSTASKATSGYHSTSKTSIVAKSRCDKCIRSQKRSHKAQQKRDLRKRLHQVKQQIRSDSAVVANRSEHSDQEADESASCSREPSPECTCIAHPRTNRPRAFEGKALVSKPLSSIPTNGVSPANVLSRYTLKGLSLCNFGYGRG